MKKFVSDFFRRGLISSGFAPIILVVLYLILQHKTGIEALSIRQVCTGIISITLLAFVAGGMNSVYQLERLPLRAAILLHGAVLYGGYLTTYLINEWLEWRLVPILVFTGIFIVGYLVVWIIICSVTRRNTRMLNEKLRIKQQSNKQ